MKRAFSFMAIVLSLSVFAGCEVDSFFDPSKTGRFEYEPTTMPVLDRLDVIEPQLAYWANATPPTPEDLMPRELTYHIYPGDMVTASIYELTVPNTYDTRVRRVDTSGFFRIPEIGDVRAAGLTAQQFQDEIIRLLRDRGVTNPQVDVVVEQAGGLRYTVSGFVQRTGQYNLDNPNLRVVDALASAGGVPSTTERVYITRQVILSPEVQPQFPQREGAQPPQTRPPDTNIDDLLRQLEENPQATQPEVSPGMIQDSPQAEPPVTIDIDQLEPIRTPQEPPVDIDVIEPRSPQAGQDDVPFYDPERGEWIRVPANGTPTPRRPVADAPAASGPPASILTRVLEIDYQQMIRGDSTQNVVIRPNDQIYVEGADQGFVYVEGEVNRPGVFALPSSGTMTLSRMIATAGGFGPIAVPSRIDLTRKIGRNREATIRLNAGAIRQRTEPDIVLKPDDHIIVGTTFWATPVAIFRNGLRMTYGFGFLLDRNFGNDVFGVPPGTGFNN